jgi:dTDP-4-dehydrorhamnose 3,5-epimerase
MTDSFEFIGTSIQGLYEIKRKSLNDNRGFFSRFFCAEQFKEIGLLKPFVQVNHSMTRKKGAVRGMHYQNIPYAETKLVTCVKGEVADIAIDIREGSKTFLNYHLTVLSDTNFKSLYIPEGFAHGFQALTKDCQLLYMHSEFYTPFSEGAIHPMDPSIKIQWPFEITEISARDRNHKFIDNTFKGVGFYEL